MRLVFRTPVIKALAENVSGVDRSKWDIFSKELSQKQEMIHRLRKEVDDKTESLKITGKEIVYLRRQVKLLQSENAILRKCQAHKESLEIQSIITKEIVVMSMEELIQKIIKVVQAYRNERVRNEEFKKALKTVQKDIASARQLEVELESLQRVHQENGKKKLVMQLDIQKVSVYKEAVKKQETVISKLERLMETSLKDAQKARQAQLEVEQLKSENLNLQKQLKRIVYREDIGELECQRLERIVANMKEELRNKRHVSNSGVDWEQDKMELEVKLHKVNARIEALNDEMIYNAKNYGKEIAQLKLIIAEKQALLDSLTMDGS